MHCPYCKNEDKVVKRGKRKNKYVKKQQYWCNRCKKYFVERNGFQGMTYRTPFHIQHEQQHQLFPVESVRVKTI